MLAWQFWGSIGAAMEVWHYGEDGIVYDEFGERVFDPTTGDFVLNGLPRAIERVRYYNMNTQNGQFLDGQATVEDVDGGRKSTFRLIGGTPQWAIFDVPPNRQVDPRSCRIGLRWPN